jgi:hypothetical protein
MGKNLEARGGIEPPIKVLQTFALPLGDRASGTTILPDLEPGIAWPRANCDEETSVPGDPQSPICPFQVLRQHL